MTKAIKVVQQQKHVSHATQVSNVLEEISHYTAVIGTQYTEENYQNLNLLSDSDDNHYHKLLKTIKTLRKLQSNNNKSNLSTEQKFKRFFQWLNTNGLDVNNLPIEVRYDQQEKGNGMFAKQKIKKGDNLIEIPRSLMLTTLSANKEKVNEIPVSYIQQMPSVKLSMHLWFEKVKKNSFWKPYIDTLPTELHLPFFWTIEELHALRGSFVQALALKLIHSSVVQYLAIYNALLKMGKKEANLFTYDEYVWSIAIVMSRQNVVPVDHHQEFALIPLWDLFNHSEDSTEITTFYYPEIDATISSAMSDYEEGNEVFIYYGSRPNSMLLLYSGFRFEGNTNDSVACYRPLIKEGDPLTTLKKLFLTKHHIHNSQILFKKIEDIQKSKTFVSARIAVAVIEDIKLLNSFDDPVGKEVSVSNELAACDFLLEICHSMLLQSGGSKCIYTSDDLLQPNLSYHQRMAISQVIEERNIVLVSIERLNDLKAKLKKRQQNRKKKQKKNKNNNNQTNNNSADQIVEEDIGESLMKEVIENEQNVEVLTTAVNALELD